MSSYFGYNGREWERAHMANAGDKDRLKNINDATKNPEKYTTSMPHGAAKVAFKVDNYTGAGKDGLRKGSPTLFYKVEEPKTVTKTVYKNKPAPKPAAKAPSAPVQLSDRAAEANAYTDAYEEVMLPRQGDYIIKDDQSVAQDFKDKYELNLTNQLREKVPGALEEKAENIKQKDAYLLNFSSGLELV